MLIAFHIGTSHSMFPPILNDAGGIHAAHARDGNLLKPGNPLREARALIAQADDMFAQPASLPSKPY
jgi:hypothetical protein